MFKIYRKFLTEYDEISLHFFGKDILCCKDIMISNLYSSQNQHLSCRYCESCSGTVFPVKLVSEPAYLVLARIFSLRSCSAWFCFQFASSPGSISVNLLLLLPTASILCRALPIPGWNLPPFSVPTLPCEECKQNQRSPRAPSLSRVY